MKKYKVINEISDEITPRIRHILENRGVDMTPVLEEEKPIEHDPKFVPRAGATYYYLLGTGVVASSAWTKTPTPMAHLENGNVFQTREIAKEVLWRRKFRRKALLFLEPQKCDWDNPAEIKYYLSASYNYHEKGEFDIMEDFFSSYQTLGQMSSSSKQNLNDFIENYEDELKRYVRNEYKIVD
jgi:hypothetical protein